MATYHIYKLRQISTDRVYIGRTTDRGLKLIQGKPVRFAEHLWFLAQGIHPTGPLQDSYTHQGDYTFEVVQTFETESKREANQIERGWIRAEHNPFNVKYVRPYASPYRIPDGTKAAIQRALMQGSKGLDIAARFCVSTATVSLLKKPLKTLGLV